MDVPREAELNDLGVSGMLSRRFTPCLFAPRPMLDRRRAQATETRRTKSGAAENGRSGGKPAAEVTAKRDFNATIMDNKMAQ